MIWNIKILVNTINQLRCLSIVKNVKGIYINIIWLKSYILVVWNPEVDSSWTPPEEPRIQLVTLI